MTKMRKLRLDVNSLTVEAFPTVEAVDTQKGTVKGHESSLGGDCPLGELERPGKLPVLRQQQR